MQALPSVFHASFDLLINECYRYSAYDNGRTSDIFQSIMKFDRSIACAVKMSGKRMADGVEGVPAAKKFRFIRLISG